MANMATTAKYQYVFAIQLEMKKTTTTTTTKRLVFNVCSG